MSETVTMRAPPAASIAGPARTIAEAFAAVAARAPGAPAVRAPEAALTYGELDAVTRRIAGLLPPSATPPHVALLLPHGAAAVAGFLGLLRARAVCVPLDPAWPDARLVSVLRGCEVSAILTDAAGAARAAALPGWRGDLWHMPELREAGMDGGPAGPPRAAPLPGDPACLYLTSGSTGRPRAILLSHATMLHGAQNYIRALSLGPRDRLAWLAPLSFGASTLPILGALLGGGGVLPFDLKARGLEALTAWLAAEGATVLPMVSSLFRKFAAALPDGGALPHVRIVKLGGEPVLRADAALWRRKFPAPAVLVNGLGLTEAGTNVCFFTVTADTRLTEPTVPLGTAAQGYTLRVVDADGRAVAAGEAGEIVVQGPHLADGYWQEPELTAARFAPLPGGEGARTFRTGDRGRFAPDGGLIGLGRQDDQWKIRGHRVEAAEVEAALLALDGVTEAAVTLQETTDGPKLAAHLVFGRAAPPAQADLRAALQAALPDYLVPSVFLTQAELPRLANGKVDRRALASPPAPAAARAAAAPRDTLELQLQSLWTKALRRATVGVTDSFFELGGDSLNAVQLFALIEQHLHARLPLTTLAAHPTIGGLAEVIRAHTPHAQPSPAALLHVGDGGPPLFCVPGAGSDAFELIAVSGHMGPHTFYALQHAGMDGSVPRHTPVVDMAARLLSAIAEVQPQGPYFLAGSSFGGVVVFEMARQLAARGERVALLALVDTYAPGYFRLRRGLSARRRALAAVRWFLPLGRKEELTRASLRDGLRERGKQLRAWLHLRRPARGAPPPAHLRHAVARLIAYRASRRYRPAPYDGRLDLFRVERQPPDILYDNRPDLGWAGLARELVTHEIPGHHGAQLNEPHVRGLAAKLCAQLAACASPPPGTFDALTPRTRAIWNELGEWWDERIGEGSTTAHEVLLPPMDELLALRAGERVLDAACGNGWLARRLARAGAEVVAFDFSDTLVARARARTIAAGLRVDYRVLDATREAPLRALGEGRFDAAVCAMGLMDISSVEPLFRAVARLLKPGGRFVFSIVHPESGALARASEGEPLTHIGLPHQPVAHYYFHRPLALLVDQAAAAGLALDAERAVTRAPSPADDWREVRRFLVGRLVPRAGGAA